MQNRKKNRMLSALLFLSAVAFGQGSLKFEPGGGPSGNGPATANQVVTFNYGDGAVYQPKVTVTFSLSNQKFSSIEGNPGVPGLTFGGSGIDGSNSGVNRIQSAPLYPRLNSISNSANANYSTNGAAPAVNVSNDHGVQLFTATDALIDRYSASGYPVNRDVEYGTLTVTFSRPVTNPVLHFTGLGGYYGYNVSNNDIYYVLGYAAKFELLNGNYNISRLAGSRYFDVTGKTVGNSAPAIGSNTQGSTIEVNNTTIRNITRYAASGSVLVTGNNITSLSFRVSIHPDGGMTTNAAGTRVSGANGRTPRWSAGANDAELPAAINGDVALLSTSLTAYTISGNVFNDANGLTDNRVNGSGTNAGGLNAVLIDAATNTVVAVVPVKTDGTYSFGNAALPGDYFIAITTRTAAAGDPAPEAVLPQGWVATGEQLGTGAGHDGKADGILTGITIGNGNLDNANFGIERIPEAEDVTHSITKPGKNAIAEGTVTTPVRGTDAEEGNMGNGNTVVITELPSNGKLFYNGNPVTAGEVFPDFDPAKLSFTELQDGTDETSFKYTFVDAAGEQGVPATYKVTWSGFLPVTFKTVEAYFDNGNLMVNWSTVMEKDNDHFEVEVSADGINFKSIGTVASKGLNGNSDSELEYSFTKAAGTMASLAGLGFLVAGLAFSSSRKRRQLLMAALFVTGTAVLAVSCNKRDQLAIEQPGKVFVRIVQVDKDGTRKASKIVQATVR
ncbi:hypothetical protein [Niabella beijingensis]|uniref:hypothetical protein n=1 Tax=Niabella beijingensis TaxID=2872700 RepID=UPI001CBFDB5F|nr:hypothetical protein [Niabella beijingensis]MBZ4192510.1 hypothetical protein [Niabella beijingensis]